MFSINRGVHSSWTWRQSGCRTWCRHVRAIFVAASHSQFQQLWRKRRRLRWTRAYLFRCIQRTPVWHRSQSPGASSPPMCACRNWPRIRYRKWCFCRSKAVFDSMSSSERTQQMLRVIATRYLYDFDNCHCHKSNKRRSNFVLSPFVVTLTTRLLLPAAAAAAAAAAARRQSEQKTSVTNSKRCFYMRDYVKSSVLADLCLSLVTKARTVVSTESSTMVWIL